VARWILALVAVGVLAVACGGRATGPGGDGSSSGASSSGGVTSSGTSSGGACVNVDASTYDASCAVDADCTVIRSGQVCSGGCDCGGDTPINVSGEARYEATIAGLHLEACPCPSGPLVRCIAQRCTACSFGPPDAGCDGG
jgi:hypothetical protein